MSTEAKAWSVMRKNGPSLEGFRLHDMGCLTYVTLIAREYADEYIGSETTVYEVCFYSKLFFCCYTHDMSSV
jgi:hypothetical protein